MTVPSNIPSTPTNISFTIGNGSLTLSWPSSYVGWILQTQTNTLNAGLNVSSNAWVDVPGSANIYTTNLPIVTSQGCVFYRLRHP